MSDALLRRRHRTARIFRTVSLGMCILGLVMLVVLLGRVLSQGWDALTWRMVTSMPSRFPEKAGIWAAIWGTIWVVLVATAVAVPIGVAAAVHLEEYAPANRLKSILEVNIANLAGVPSVVYGILGLTVFVRALHLGRSVLAAGLTLGILVLPVVIVAAREAVRAVPATLREAAAGLGATRWQTIRHHVLPTALPGILTGAILAVSRAMGEAAPLIVVGALSYVANPPKGLGDAFTVLPVQIFNWSARPQHAFHALAAAAIVVMLVVLLSMNALAIWLRQRAERKVRW